MSDRLSKIRNFCIIAHIDHGKSTLADRILETTGVFQKREMVEQILDSMELERERGITIKSKAVHMHYTAKDGKTYTLNLIDTPGHVDFTYEVSRALAACEGALLVVDATQGIEAQTLANCYMALDHDLEIIPVINKIDLPSAQPEEVRQEIEDVIGLDASYAPCVSAKTGLNIDQVLEAVVNYVPAPQGDENAPLQALIFDAFYDNYRGAICFIRVKQGTIRTGMRMRMMATGGEFDIVEVGTFAPGYQPCDELKAGDVGYVAASIKDVRETRVGDTITDAMNPADCLLPGYRQVTPMVYCGVHMDIITERLEREWDLNLVTTAPSVIYRITKTDGTVLMCDNPMALPPIGEIAMMEEPFVHAEIFTPQDSVGTIMDLCQDRRGIFLDMQYEGTRVKLNYDIPLNEIIFDFFDQIKSRSRGYASFDYEFKDYRESQLVKLDILLNGEICDAFSIIVHRDKAYGRGRSICEKLKDVIPRQMFEIPIQAAIGGKVIARETVKAMRKDVLAKCYGGDISRKKKLLEKQKEGKKRMRQFGTVQVPSEAFLAVLKMDSD